MFKLLRNLKRKERILFLFVVMLVLLQVFLDLKLPDYMSEITKLVQTQGSNMSDILKNGGFMISCAVGSLFASVITGLLTSKISANFTRFIREKLFNKVENLSMSEIKKFSTSSLLTRCTNDITQIQIFVAMGMQLLLKAPITAIWAISKILSKNWEWSMVTGIAVIILLSIAGILMSIVIPKFKIIQQLTDKINVVTRENLKGIRVVRAFNAEKYQEEKFDKVNSKLTKELLFNQKAFAIIQPVMYFIMYGLTLCIYTVGAFMINNTTSAMEQISLFGDMIVFSTYAMQVIISFLMLAFIFMMFPRAEVSANRINEVLNTKISIKDGNINKDKTNEKGNVEFKNVYFKYPDSEEYLLENISFKANAGETVAFIGSTGSGKSTLVNLIPRFYDVTSGEILVDGINVKDYNSEFLYDKIGYVPQKAVMFSGSVNYNVAYGKNGNIAESTIKEAIDVAQAKEFVEKMDEKYETNIAMRRNKHFWWTKTKTCYSKSNCKKP